MKAVYWWKWSRLFAAAILPERQHITLFARPVKRLII